MGGQKPDWLPVGWRVSVKIRNCGRKDKYYINSSNGRKFNSKLEVLRYLKSSETSKKPKEESKVEIKKSAAENLPPGWIKEIRTKKTGSKTRSDPYYIDPVSGRQFRSMVEVFRYLESKDSEKKEGKKYKKLKQMGSNAKDSVNIHVDNCLEQSEDEEDSRATKPSDKPQLVKEEKQQADNMEEIKKLDGDKKLRSGRKVAALKEVYKQEMNVVGQLAGEDDSMDEKLPVKLRQVNEIEQHKFERRRSTRLADSVAKDHVTKDQSLQSGSEGVAEENTTSPVTNGIDQREGNKSMGGSPQLGDVTYQRKRKNSNDKCTSDLPRRTSKRLARVEFVPSSEVKADERTGDDTTKNVGGSVLSHEPETDATGETSDRLKDANGHPPKSRTENPNTNNQKNPVTQEYPSSLENDEKGHEKGIGSPLDGLLLDPCIEFAIKTLTGAIPIEDVYKIGNVAAKQTPASSSQLDSGDIWADPCFEFAVKTLTGEVPKEGALPLPKFSPLNCSLSQFECGDVKKSFVSVKDPSFPPHAVNGSSQSFVGSSIRHGVERRMGNVKFL